MEPTLLALYVLREMTIAGRFGQRLTNETLASRIGVRKGDVATIVRALHREGYVDATLMRLTFPGFALGQSLKKASLKELRARATTFELVAA